MRLYRSVGIGPLVRNLSLFFVAIAFLFFAVIGGQFPSPEEPYVSALSSQFYYDKGKTVAGDIAARVGSQTLKNILKMEMPVLSIADSTVQVKPVSGFNLIKNGLNLLVGIKLEDPLTYLKAEIPMMAVMPITPATADSFDESSLDEISEPPGTTDPTTPPAEVTNRIISKEPLIALYNTHSSETYELTDGVTHQKGKAGGVAIVTQEMQKFIEENYQIPVLFSPTIHDMAFNSSYVESHKTAMALVKDNPSLKMILDVHRDGAMSREQSLVEINGEQVAKILIVVGTDARAEHPKWRENLDFAKKLAAKLDAMYPGLSRGISIKQGRYNQELSTGALLVEIGSNKNTTDEAVAAGKLFAAAVVALLNDMQATAAANP